LGQSTDAAELSFIDGLNLIYGASNTGKTFFLKSLDFMLGASGDLPEIEERLPYDRIAFTLGVPPEVDILIVRAMAGGSFEVNDKDSTGNPKKLSARHKAGDDNNLSAHLLNYLELNDKRIAMDANGVQRSLSFRDLARYCIVDETTIQSEESPFESGQVVSKTGDRSVLKLLLTGQDDSAIVPVVDRRTFRTSKAARIAVIDEMLESIAQELEADYPDADDVPAQDARLEATFAEMRTQLNEAEASVSGLLNAKRETAVEITRNSDRLGELRLNLARFAQLGTIYKSDIARLESLEEASFLLTLGGEKPCPLCGALPEAQQHTHAASEISDAKKAAIAEIEKIRALDGDLARTVVILRNEEQTLQGDVPMLRDRLRSIELDISRSAPETREIRQKLNELLTARDHVKHGLELLKQRRDLEELKSETTLEKEPTSADKPKLGVPGTVAHEYAQHMSQVLKKWHFPGKCHVSFDEGTYDLRIDGKLRKANGKGVRAITHAATKIAMLLYCRERDLPHPGFVLLDTPLLTYRDPLASREGELSADEVELAKSSLKTYFFNHLLELRGVAQTIILENVDPPEAVRQAANTITFHGQSGGRFGLFPTRTSGQG
jgi:predicted nuclease with TOPRIM domain